ncbi:hypothetical protein AVEN_79646-1 [Araneus ventricosus]|uniref:Uncharacterized protein n=1 Tax=Araneus ventricosus TaxID=182803 RepID=A0A4Y2K592_ARAVE|nr:hypothetical protein AVEN_79646-1 [Araneus ventricosus]
MRDPRSASLPGAPTWALTQLRDILGTAGKSYPVLFPYLSVCFAVLVGRESDFFRFPREWFCKEYPEFCENPPDALLLCWNHLHLCKSNFSDIMTPKIGYYSEEASDEMIKLLWDSFLNYSERYMFQVRNLHSNSGNTWKQVPTIVQDPFPHLSMNVAEGLYLKCVSLNLHLAGKSEEEFEEIFVMDSRRRFHSRVRNLTEGLLQGLLLAANHTRRSQTPAQVSPSSDEV